MVSKDSVVAIASCDRGCNYYLLKVTGDGTEVLEVEDRDQWGEAYPPGAEIIRGHFLIKDDTNLFQYRIDATKIAYVYAATVRYICSELENSPDGEGRLCLTEDLHLEIMESLNGF